MNQIITASSVVLALTATATATGCASSDHELQYRAFWPDAATPCEDIAKSVSVTVFDGSGTMIGHAADARGSWSAEGCTVSMNIQIPDEDVYTIRMQSWGGPNEIVKSRAELEDMGWTIPFGKG